MIIYKSKKLNCQMLNSIFLFFCCLRMAVVLGTNICVGFFFSSNYFNKNRFCAINPMTSFVFLHPPFLSLSHLSLSLSI